MAALVLPSFSILFKSLAMSKQMGIEDQDSEVHEWSLSPACAV